MILPPAIAPRKEHLGLLPFFASAHKFNIIGDIILVFPLKLGMTGAALATVAGSMVQTIVLLVYTLAGKTSLHLAKPYQWRKAVRNISVLGIGADVSQVAMTVVTYT